MRFQERIYLRMLSVAIVVILTGICVLMCYNLTNSSNKSSLKERFPISFKFLPYLSDDPIVWQPIYMGSYPRSNVNYVFGFVSTSTNNDLSPFNSLKNILRYMSEKEMNDSLIIILITDINIDRAISTIRLLKSFFEPHFKSGLIDVILSPVQYYPKELRRPYDHFTDTEIWNKQNLDIAYLMGYTNQKGKYYIHLKDNIVIRENFISSIKAAIDKKQLNGKEWFLLDFCNEGFFGKLFKSTDLPYLATYFQLFYKNKPVDLLLYNYLETKFCTNNTNYELCSSIISQLWSQKHAILFQRYTTKLSKTLERKKSATYKKFGLYRHYKNPSVTTNTSIRAVKGYTIKLAYSGESYFHGGIPKQNDKVIFVFNPPTELIRYFFRSGTVKYPNEHFYDTTVQVLPLEMRNQTIDTSLAQLYKLTLDGFYIVGSFDADGIAEGEIDHRFGILEQLRLMVHSSAHHWIYLTDILLEAKENSVLL